MSERNYRIVFSGEIADLHSLPEVKRRFATAFNIEGPTINRLFSGNAITIRKELNYEEAKKWQDNLARMGAVCRIEGLPAAAAETPFGAACPEPSESLKGISASVDASGFDTAQSRLHDPLSIGPSRFPKTPDGAGDHGPTASAHPWLRGAAKITTYDNRQPKGQLIVLALLLFVLSLILQQVWATREIEHPPGILAPSQPDQVMIAQPKPWRIQNHVVVPLAQFRLKARVLGKERYRFDPESKLCPVDLALGWGPMSDQRILDELEIVQGNRRFVVLPRDKNPPLPWPVIMENSSNMHMIPANDEVARALFGLRTGDLIHLSGCLVGIQHKGRWTWVSSLTRTDTGDGACEIVWVEHITRDFHDE